MTDDGWVIRVCNDPEKDWIERSKKEEMTDDIVTRQEQEIDFVEYLRLWASPDSNDQAVRDLHKAADEIERLRVEQKVLELMEDNAIDEIERLRAELRTAWDIADRAVAVIQSLAYGVRCEVPSANEVIDLYVASERSVESAYQVEESERERAETEEFHLKQAHRD